MPAPRRSATPFKQLDANHALAAKESLTLAVPHLIDAITNLEFGVPCENCEEVRALLDFVGCALTFTQESILRLSNTEWPGVPLLDREGREVKEWAKT